MIMTIFFSYQLKLLISVKLFKIIKFYLRIENDINFKIILIIIGIIKFIII